MERHREEEGWTLEVGWWVGTRADVRRRDLGKKGDGSGARRAGNQPQKGSLQACARKASRCSALQSLHSAPQKIGTRMKTNIRRSKAKHAKKTGYRTRQQTKGGRKTNRRQRAKHGKI